jgi:hypothetical protein
MGQTEAAEERVEVMAMVVTVMVAVGSSPRRALAASSTPLGRAASGLQMRCVAVVHERRDHGGRESAAW